MGSGNTHESNETAREPESMTLYLKAVPRDLITLRVKDFLDTSSHVSTSIQVPKVQDQPYRSSLIEMFFTIRRSSNRLDMA